MDSSQFFSNLIRRDDSKPWNQLIECRITWSFLCWWSLVNYSYMLALKEFAMHPKFNPWKMVGRILSHWGPVTSVPNCESSGGENHCAIPPPRWSSGRHLWLQSHTCDLKHPKKQRNCTYCWWTKSCTTKDDYYPIIYRVLTIPGGAGFRPSTVGPGL